MKQRHWNYRARGTDGDGGEWSCSGACTAADEASARAVAAKLVFQQLTGGRAVYGKPGQGGCRGPYEQTEFVVEERPA